MTKGWAVGHGSIHLSFLRSSLGMGFAKRIVRRSCGVFESMVEEYNAHAVLAP